MPITAQNSVEYDKAFVSKTGVLSTVEAHGRVRMAYFTHTQVGLGDAGSSVALAFLPPGRVRLLASQSKAYVNWTTASATLDLGWDAYTDSDGATVAADVDGIDDGLNVDTVGSFTFGTVAAVLATGGTKLFDSSTGVVIRATLPNVALAIGDVINGYLLYVVD